MKTTMEKLARKEPAAFEPPCSGSEGHCRRSDSAAESLGAQARSKEGQVCVEAACFTDLTQRIGRLRWRWTWRRTAEAREGGGARAPAHGGGGERAEARELTPGQAHQQRGVE